MVGQSIVSQLSLTLRHSAVQDDIGKARAVNSNETEVNPDKPRPFALVLVNPAGSYESAVVIDDDSDESTASAYCWQCLRRAIPRTKSLLNRKRLTSSVRLAV